MEHEDNNKSGNGIVWDLPIRLFHWMLVLTITAAWMTTSTLYYETHLSAGYLLLLLLLFRTVWGFMGGTYARFRHFAHPWPAVRQHLLELMQGRSSHTVGHNPAGGWMIFLLLGTLLLISISGLLTLGGEEQTGPLNGWVSIASGALMHQLHETLAWFLISLIPIHLAGVAIERWLSKRKLVQAMITGSYTHLRTRSTEHGVGWVSGILLTTPAFALWFSSAEPNPVALYSNSAWESDPRYSHWQEEGSGCHTPHHPSLLPSRSWKRVMAQQENHFEEDLALDEEPLQQITQFLIRYSAEQAYSEAAWKIDHSIEAGHAPLRITDTRYWRNRHHEIDEQIWLLPSVGGKIHCDGCHQDAAAGSFQDQAISLPGI